MKPAPPVIMIFRFSPFTGLLLGWVVRRVPGPGPAGVRRFTNRNRSSP